LDYFSFLTWISLSLRPVLTASSVAFRVKKCSGNKDRFCL
jgi:hypothetical protein